MKKEVLEERAEEAISIISPNSIYFAHPVNYYVGGKLNTHGDTETRLINTISDRFPQLNVYNPNQLHNQENYKIWKEETGSGMDYFFDIILPRMQSGIVLPFEDGMISAGAFGEVEYLKNNEKPIWEINESGIIIPIKYLESDRKLSIEETRGRIYSE